MRNLHDRYNRMMRIMGSASSSGKESNDLVAQSHLFGMIAHVPQSIGDGSQGCSASDIERNIWVAVMLKREKVLSLMNTVTGVTEELNGQSSSTVAKGKTDGLTQPTKANHAVPVVSSAIKQSATDVQVQSVDSSASEHSVALPYGIARVVRDVGATVRSGVDIDNSDVVKRLPFDTIVYFDDIREIDSIPGETVRTKRLRIVEVGDSAHSAMPIGWASLAGRTFDDQEPILHIISMPRLAALTILPLQTVHRQSDAIRAYETSTQISSSSKHAIIAEDKLSMAAVISQRNIFSGNKSNIGQKRKSDLSGIAATSDRRPQSLAESQMNLNNAQPFALKSQKLSQSFLCPLCELDITLFDIPARNHHINSCTDFLGKYDN